ncbi:MAG: hypothetical protein K6G55_07430 [Selenomonadaceae bacterium]|nr:hypothetical protein [Selenomonadaceae bacterium]
MFGVLVTIVVVVFSLLIVLALIMKSPKIFLYGLVAIGLAIQFVAKKIVTALPWTVGAIAALTVGFYSLGQQFFELGDAKSFVETFLPPRDSQRKTLSLALIELMMVFREKFLIAFPIFQSEDGE